MKQQKNELETQNKLPVLGKDSVEYIKEKVKHFLVSIKRSSPEEQHNLLKEFIESITSNKVAGGYKLIYTLEAPNCASGNIEILIKKTLYFSSDSKYQLE